MSELTFTDDNFEAEVTQSNAPALVDFWAPWCGPCQMQGPIIAELAKDFEGKTVKIGKLNVDEAPKTAETFGVMSIPTILIIKDGKEVDRMVGVQNKDVLTEKLNSYLS